MPQITYTGTFKVIQQIVDWINNFTPSIGDLDDLTDVDISSPQNDEVLKYNSTTQKWENGAGGGGSGGHTIVDQNGTSMPQENKLQFAGAVSVSDDSVNGQTVVDVEGGGNYYLNTFYSTDEKKVGYWTDNKPLYQKTWLVPKSSLNSGETTYTHGDDLHIDSLVSVEGAVGNSRPLVEYHSNSIWACSIYNIGNNAFWIYLGSSVYSNMSASSYVKVTLRYTKTTDTADPNPQTGGVIYLPSIYSTEEREVGCWTDGKPLYQKTVHISALPGSTQIGQYIDYPHGISDIDTICYYECITHYPTNVYGNTIKTPRVTFSTAGFNNQSSIDAYCDLTNIRIEVGQDRSSANADFTIWYTKTTDTAGSGSWTPSGVPSVHYSENEKVIGTWINGKTLYEKVVVVPNTSQIDNSFTYPHGITNQEFARVANAVLCDASGYSFDMPLINNDGSNLGVRLDSTNIIFRGTGFLVANPNRNMYVTIQYTKITS